MLTEMILETAKCTYPALPKLPMAQTAGLIAC